MRRNFLAPAVHRSFALFALALLPAVLDAQERSMARDPALDNLVHPPGTETLPFATLGNVRRAGDGPRTLLLLPGLGFGDEIWADFIERHQTDYRMIAVTLPGFGGTRPLPMPADDVAFAKTAWTRSSLQALERLLEEEKPRQVTIVAHWALATQIALRLALDHPDQVESVILASGVLKSYYESSPQMLDWTLEQRARFAEGMGQQWFKTVTRETWDDNNFMSYDYAVNPRRGLVLWRKAQAPTLPVWIRYLLEFYSLDLTPELKNLKVPTLVVQPGFDDPAYYVEPKMNYMRNLCHDSWRGVAELGAPIEFTTVPQSRLFLQYDRPEELDRVVRDFLKRTAPPLR